MNDITEKLLTGAGAGGAVGSIVKAKATTLVTKLVLAGAGAGAVAVIAGAVLGGGNVSYKPDVIPRIENGAQRLKESFESVDLKSVDENLEKEANTTMDNLLTTFNVVQKVQPTIQGSGTNFAEGREALREYKDESLVKTQKLLERMLSLGLEEQAEIICEVLKDIDRNKEVESVES